MSNSTASSFASDISDLTFVGRTSTRSVAKQRVPKSKRIKKKVREGHVHEEQYLVQYLRRLVPSDHLLRRVRNLANSLVFFREATRIELLLYALEELKKASEEMPDDIRVNVDSKLTAELDSIFTYL